MGFLHEAGLMNRATANSFNNLGPIVSKLTVTVHIEPLLAQCAVVYNLPVSYHLNRTNAMCQFISCCVFSF